MQAALWFAEEVGPIQDDAFLAAPREFTTKYENRDFRELFLALKAHDCQLQGDLVIEFLDDELFREREAMNITSVSLKKGLEVKLDNCEFYDVTFENSYILQTESHLDKLLKNKIAEHRLKFKSDGRLLERISIKNITLNMPRLMSAFSAKENPGTEKEKADVSRARGAPFKYKWDEIWAEIVVQTELDALPDTQADCIRWILDWCEKKYGEAPGETMLKQKLKHVYNHPRKVGKYRPIRKGIPGSR